MSYPVDLDEISTKKLREELKRRVLAIAKETCPYCGRLLGSEPTCKMVDIHWNRAHS